MRTCLSRMTSRCLTKRRSRRGQDDSVSKRHVRGFRLQYPAVTPSPPPTRAMDARVGGFRGGGEGVEFGGAEPFDRLGMTGEGRPSSGSGRAGLRFGVAHGGFEGEVVAVGGT